MMARGFTFGDIARIGNRLNERDLTIFAGIVESVTEGDAEAVRYIYMGLTNGTIGGTLPVDAIELLIALALYELER